MCVDSKNTKDPGDAEYRQQHSHGLRSQPWNKVRNTTLVFNIQQYLQSKSRLCQQKNSLDCISISMNLVTLSADSRYDPGHRYQNADVHLQVREQGTHTKHTDAQQILRLYNEYRINSGVMQQMLIFAESLPQWQTELVPQTPKWLHSSVTANSWESKNRGKVKKMRFLPFQVKLP